MADASQFETMLSRLDDKQLIAFLVDMLGMFADCLDTAAEQLREADKRAEERVYTAIYGAQIDAAIKAVDRD